MRFWAGNTEKTQTVAVLLFPRFSNHCLANAVEPLRAANEFLMREAYRWDFVTLDGEAVESSSGLPVLPSSTLATHPGGDFLFVASSYDVRSYAEQRTSRALRSATKRFDTVVGMDTGAWLMAQAGLLDGLNATIHWDEYIAFSETFASVEAVTDRYVIAEDRITCGGATTSFELVLDLIARTHGEAIRLEVAALFFYQRAPLQTGLLNKKPKSELVGDCVALMTSTIENPMRINALAEELNTTQKTLSRAFQFELGAPPVAVYRRLRLGAAKRFVTQSEWTITEIALRCGYKNAAAMTRAFVEQFGVAPSHLRKRQ